jgi:hypothetical protein
LEYFIDVKDLFYVETFERLESESYLQVIGDLTGEAFYDISLVRLSNLERENQSVRQRQTPGDLLEKDFGT